MKPKYVLLVALVTLIAIGATTTLTLAQGPTGTGPALAPLANAGTAFTYQGQLKNGAGAVNGPCDFEFRLYDDLAAGNLIGNNPQSVTTVITNGLFTTPIDFGAGAINGEARWLATTVRCPAGTGSYAPLTPRQPLTPAPMALALPGLYTQPNGNTPSVVGGYIGNVISPTVRGGVIAGGGFPGYENRVQADFATVGGGQSNTASGALTALGGGIYNIASGGAATIGGGYDNIASGGWATVGGGQYNTVSGDRATLGGGFYNIASGAIATVGGGIGNTASGPTAAIGGGSNNSASGDRATVGGGQSNTAGNTYATVSGGTGNTASGAIATVPGGNQNTALGTYSLAAGNRAKANHAGAFVWGDSTAADIASSADNQFIVRASGGVGINTNSTTGNGLTVNGQIIAGGVGVNPGSTESFVSRGALSGISLDDRTNSSLRWVIYPQNGALRFFNGADRVAIEGDGSLTLTALGSAGGSALCRNATGQIAYCSSSLRYKNNVADLSLGLATIAQLRPVTFDWKETGQPDLGFVAEEVDQVTPLLTTRNADGQIEGVKYDRISAVLVKAVQEQQQQIAALTAENAALDKKTSDLEARLTALEHQAGSADPTANPQTMMLGLGGLATLGIILRGRREQGGHR